MSLAFEQRKQWHSSALNNFFVQAGEFAAAAGSFVCLAGFSGLMGLTVRAGVGAGISTGADSRGTAATCSNTAGAAGRVFTVADFFFAAIDRSFTSRPWLIQPGAARGDLGLVRQAENLPHDGQRGCRGR